MSMMRAAKIEIDEELDAVIEDGKIIIEKPYTRKKYDLKDLLAKATPENKHEFKDKLVGKELW